MDSQTRPENRSTPETWQDYVTAKVTPLLAPNERIEFTSGLSSKPRTLAAVFWFLAILAIIGGWALLVSLQVTVSDVLAKSVKIIILPVWIAGILVLRAARKTYFLVITNDRLVLIETKQSFLSHKHQLRDLGIVQLSRNEIEHVRVKRDGTLTLSLAGGNRKSFQIDPPLDQSILTIAHDVRRKEVQNHLQRIKELLGGN